MSTTRPRSAGSSAMSRRSRPAPSPKEPCCGSSSAKGSRPRAPRPSSTPSDHGTGTTSGPTTCPTTPPTWSASSATAKSPTPTSSPWRATIRRPSSPSTRDSPPSTPTPSTSSCPEGIHPADGGGPCLAARPRRSASDGQLGGQADRLILGERSHGLDAHPSVGRVDQRHLGRDLIVRRLDDGDGVVLTHRQVEADERGAELGGAVAGVLQPFADGLEVLDAGIGV